MNYGNDTDRRKLNYWDKYLANCHFVHHKFDMVWSGIEPVSSRKEAGD